jgi:hypothetical protein
MINKEAAVALMTMDEDAVVSGGCVLVGGGGFPPFSLLDLLFVRGYVFCISFSCQSPFYYIFKLEYSFLFLFL